MMVLDLHEGQARSLRIVTCPFGCEVLGVHIACQRFGGEVEQLLETRLRFQPSVVDVGVFQIADMLRDERLAVSKVGKRVLLLGTSCEHDRLLV